MKNWTWLGQESTCSTRWCTMIPAFCRTFPRRSFQVFGPYFTSSRTQYPRAYVSNNSSSEKSPWKWRVPLFLGVGSFIGVGAWVFEGDNPGKRIRLLQMIPLRMARNVSTATIMVTGASQLDTAILHLHFILTVGLGLPWLGFRIFEVSYS